MHLPQTTASSGITYPLNMTSAGDVGIKKYIFATPASDCPRLPLPDFPRSRDTRRALKGLACLEITSTSRNNRVVQVYVMIVFRVLSRKNVSVLILFNPFVVFFWYNTLKANINR